MIRSDIPRGYTIAPIKATNEMREAAAKCLILRPDRSYPLWSILADQDERGTVLTIDDILSVYAAMIQAVPSVGPNEWSAEQDAGADARERRG